MERISTNYFFMDTQDIKNAAHTFLTEPDRLTAVIGSSASDGNVHVATVYYFVDDAFNFYFMTAARSEKYNNLCENKNAALVVGFGPSQTTIQGQGAAQLLEKGSDEELQAIAHLKARLQKHENETWPIFQLESFERESIAVFKFVPQKLQVLNLENESYFELTTENMLQIL
jgi:nitroimidazol reductase NimA-like FMN-containing flavoprotein (pyridoxamine 5'-phosphate oxidase superfamily)